MLIVHITVLTVDTMVLIIHIATVVVIQGREKGVKSGMVNHGEELGAGGIAVFFDALRATGRMELGIRGRLWGVHQDGAWVAAELYRIASEALDCF